jgi:hypothetical protein
METATEKRKAGRPKVDDKRVPVSHAIKKSYKTMLNKAAKIEHRSISRIVEDGLLDYFVKMGYPHETLI